MVRVPKSLLLATLCVFGAFSAGFAQLQSPSAFPVVKVGKTEFTRGKVDSMATQLAAQQFQGKEVPPQAISQMKQMVVENLVAGELVRQEAAAIGLKAPQSRVDSLYNQMKKQMQAALPGGDFNAYLKKMGYTDAKFRDKVKDQVTTEMLLEKIAPYPEPPTTAEAKAFFESNKSKFPVNDSVAGFQIYLNIDKGDNEQVIAEKSKFLDGLAAQVRIGKADFRQLAARNSDDPEAKKDGGMVDPFLPKAKGAAWVTALSGTKVGEISPVFRDGSKLVIFAMAARNDGKFDSYIEQIGMHLGMLKEQERMAKLSAYVQQLAGKYGVKFYDKSYQPADQGGPGDMGSGEMGPGPVPPGPVPAGYDDGNYLMKPAP